MQPLPITSDPSQPYRPLPLELYPSTGDSAAYALAQDYAEEMQHSFAAHVRHNRVMRYQPYFFSLQDGTPYPIPNVDFTEDGIITAQDLDYIRDPALRQQILTALQGRNIATVTVDEIARAVPGIPRERFAETLHQAQTEVAMLQTFITRINSDHYGFTLSTLADLNRLLRAPNFYTQWRTNTTRPSVVLTPELMRLIDFPGQRIIPRSYFSDEVWGNLVRDGFIDNDGNILPGFDETADGFEPRFSAATASLSPLQKAAVRNLLRQAQAYTMALNRLLLEATYPALCPQLNPVLTFRPLQDPDRYDLDIDDDCAEFISVSESVVYYSNDELLLRDSLTPEYFYRLYMFGEYGLRRDTLPHAWTSFSPGAAHSPGVAYPWQPTALPPVLLNRGWAWRQMQDVGGEGGIIYYPRSPRDSGNSAADGETQMAELLFYAHIYSTGSWYSLSPNEPWWSAPSYLDDARELAEFSWDSFVIDRRLPASYGPSFFYDGNFSSESEEDEYFISAPVLSAGYPDFNVSGEVDASYFFTGPQEYVFPFIDPQHSWLALARSSYNILFYEMGGMPADWRGLDRFGRLTNSSVFYRLTDGAYYDAQRILLRQAEACSYFGSQRACEYLSYRMEGDTCESPGPICTYLDLLDDSPNHTLPAGIHSDGTPIRPDPAIPESLGIDGPRGYSDCAYLAALFVSGNREAATTLYGQVRARTRCYAPGIPGDEECPVDGPAENQFLYWYDAQDTVVGAPSPDCHEPLLPHTFDGYYTGEICGQAYYVVSSAFPSELTQGIERERQAQALEARTDKPPIPVRHIDAEALETYFRDHTLWEAIQRALIATGFINADGEIQAYSETFHSQGLFQDYIRSQAAFRALGLTDLQIGRLYRALQPPNETDAGRVHFTGGGARNQLSQRELADYAETDQLRETLAAIIDADQPILRTVDADGHPVQPIPANFPQLARIRELDDRYSYQLYFYFSDFTEYYNNAITLLSAFAQQAIEHSSKEDIALALTYAQRLRELTDRQEQEMFTPNPYSLSRLDLTEAVLRSQTRILDYMDFEDTTRTVDGTTTTDAGLLSERRSEMLAFYQTGIDQALSAIQGFLIETDVSRPDYASVANALITIGDLYMRMHELVEREGYPEDFPHPAEYFLDKAEEFYGFVALMRIVERSDGTIEGFGLEVHAPDEGLDFSISPRKIVKAIRFNHHCQHITQREHDEAQQAVRLRLGATARARAAAIYSRRQAVRTLGGTLRAMWDLESAVSDLEVSSLRDDDFALTSARASLGEMYLFWSDLTRSQLWPSLSPDLLGDEALLTDFEALASNTLSAEERIDTWQRVIAQVDRRPPVSFDQTDIDIIHMVAQPSSLDSDQLTHAIDARLQGSVLSEIEIETFAKNLISYASRNALNPERAPICSIIYSNLTRLFSLFATLHPELAQEITTSVNYIHQLINSFRVTQQGVEQLVPVVEDFNRRIIAELARLLTYISNTAPIPAAGTAADQTRAGMTNLLRFTSRIRIFDFISQVSRQAQDLFAQVPEQYIYLYAQANVKIREGAIRSGAFMDREFSYQLPRYTNAVLSDSPLEEGEFVQLQDDYNNLILLVGSATQVTASREGYVETVVHPQDLDEAERLAQRVIQNSSHVRHPFSLYFRMHAQLKLAEILIRREEASARRTHRTPNYTAVIPIFRTIMDELSTLTPADLNLMSFRPYSFLAELFHEWANASTGRDADQLGLLAYYMCFLSDASYDTKRRKDFLRTRFHYDDQLRLHLITILGNAADIEAEERTRQRQRRQ